MSHSNQSVPQSPLSLPSNVILSTSCPQQLDTRFLESSLDSLQLTQMEIDAIRNLGRPGRGSDVSSPSTPTSQLSQPDFVDPRPDIYRFAYISPGSRSQTSDSASVSAEGGDSRAGSKFDEIVVASMEHQGSHHGVQHQRLKVKSVTIHEGKDADETLLKHRDGDSHTKSLPTDLKSTSNTAEPETHAASTSVPVESGEVVVSIGDALVAIQQGKELTASDIYEAHQPPVTMAADVPMAGPSRPQEHIISRIHKGCWIYVNSYSIAACKLLR